MNVVRRISLRYLVPGGLVSLSSVLNWVSVAGVTLGTALLIVILSVFNGFFQVVQELLLEEDPGVRIEAVDKAPFVPSEDLMSWLSAREEVRGAYAVVEGRALIVNPEGEDQVVNVKGIDPSEAGRMETVDERIRFGRPSLGVEEGRPGVLLTLNLVNRLGLRPGDRVAMLTAEGMRRTLTSFSSPGLQAFTIRGAVAGHPLSPEESALVHIEAARRLFGLRAEWSAVEVALVDPDVAEAVKKGVEQAFPGRYAVSTWYDLNRPLYDVMRLEKWASYTILMVIILVAVLNIVGSLTMIVLQKRRDIGILLAMGLTPDRLRAVFLWHGAWIGLAGCLLGGGIGLGLCAVQDAFGVLKLSSAFLIEAYPVQVRPGDVALVMAGTFTLCLLASLYPAMRAETVQPADAVR